VAPELTVSDDQNEMRPVPGGLLNRISAKDIRRKRLSGRVQPGQSFEGNFVESRLQNVEFEQVNLARCDWKDCRIEGALLIDCDLGHASFITNAFFNSRFVRCRFPDTGISDCSFMECIFDECDFTSIIVKTSRFESCHFVKCRTSNRIVESSLLLETRWERMQLEIATVLGNFGLRRSELHQCTLVRRIGGSEQDASKTELTERDALSPIEEFRLSYFETGIVDGNSEILDKALHLGNWGKDAVIQASLGVQLSGFAQFLLALYMSDQMPFYPLLLLHSQNFNFLEWLSDRGEALPLYQVAAGVHLTLTREVDGFLFKLTDVTRALSSSQILHLVAEGPVDVSYFQNWFGQQELSRVKVLAVRPRHSPVDLTVLVPDYPAVVVLAGLLLATRLRFELSRVSEDLRVTNGHSAQTAQTSQPLIAFSAGLSSSRPAEYEINVRTLLPRSLLVDLHLNVSVAVFKRVREVLVGVLKPAAGSAPPQSPPQ
jgi:uncharacterized protein YjbI with pentapeptide repeats